MDKKNTDSQHGAIKKKVCKQGTVKKEGKVKNQKCRDEEKVKEKSKRLETGQPSVSLRSVERSGRPPRSSLSCTSFTSRRGSLSLPVGSAQPRKPLPSKTPSPFTLKSHSSHNLGHVRASLSKLCLEDHRLSPSRGAARRRDVSRSTTQEFVRRRGVSQSPGPEAVSRGVSQSPGPEAMSRHGVSQSPGPEAVSRRGVSQSLSQATLDETCQPASTDKFHSTTKANKKREEATVRQTYRIFFKHSLCTIKEEEDEEIEEHEEKKDIHKEKNGDKKKDGKKK